MKFLGILSLAACLAAGSVTAQTATPVAPVEGQAEAVAPVAPSQTLADIRTEIAELSHVITGLRAELAVNNPAVSGVANTGPVLDRVDGLEAEVRRVIGQVEELQFRIERIVADGTNRIGDLEFRLLELEGGDFGTLGDTVPLGEGDPNASSRQSSTTTDTATTPPETAPAPSVVGVIPADLSKIPDLRPKPRDSEAVVPVLPSVTDAQTPTPQPAPDTATAPAATAQAPEDVVFQNALTAFRSGDYFVADRGFATYIAQYPNAPRTGEAAYWRGESLAAQNDWSTAARSYLDSFSGSPSGPFAPEALFRLGVSLGRLGQAEEACLTLAEVQKRYPDISSDLQGRVGSEQAALGCS